jgi:hypothetical protein
MAKRWRMIYTKPVVSNGQLVHYNLIHRVWIKSGRVESSNMGSRRERGNLKEEIW